MPHIPIRTTPVPTFGALRHYGQGFTVECRRCDHAARISYKASRFLISRLPDTLELSSASGLFRCSACNYDLVKITPEPLPAARLEAGRS